MVNVMAKVVLASTVIIKGWNVRADEFLIQSLFGHHLTG